MIFKRDDQDSNIMLLEKKRGINQVIVNSFKAGLENINTDVVTAQIEDASRGSKFTIYQQKKQLRVAEQAKEIAKQVSKLQVQLAPFELGNADENGNPVESRNSETPNILSMNPLKRTMTRVDKFITECETFTLKSYYYQDLSTRRIFLHLDMDAFFAAVETLLDPSLNGIPMAVGGSNMLCTANYLARQYGVSSAMPGYIAKRLCPSLVIVPGKYHEYKRFSHRVMAILQEYDPHLKSFSLDEASLDIQKYFFTKNLDLCSISFSSSSEGEEVFRKRIHELVHEIRGRIEYETGLTCSVGVSYSRSLSKLCSNVNKPNGQFILPFDFHKVRLWLATQSVRRIQGVGKVTAQLLAEGYQIFTCEDVFKKRYILAELFGEGHWQWLLSSCLGLQMPAALTTFAPFFEVDDRITQTVPSMDTSSSFPKSISIDKTLDKSTTSQSLLEGALLKLAFQLEKQLVLKGLRGLTLTVKVKASDFSTKTKAKTHSNFIKNDANDIYEFALPLLRTCLPCEARLLGLRISGISPIRQDCTHQTTSEQPILDAFIKSSGFPSSTETTLLPPPTCSHCQLTDILFKNPLYFYHHQRECSHFNNHRIMASTSVADPPLKFEKIAGPFVKFPEPLSELLLSPKGPTMKKKKSNKFGKEHHRQEFTLDAFLKLK